MRMSQVLSGGLVTIYALLPLNVYGEQLQQDYLFLKDAAMLVKILKKLEDKNATNIKL